MTAVTISPKYQVVIPKEVRESMGLKPGQKVEIFQFQGRIEIVPLAPIESMRGFLQGINATFERAATEPTAACPR